MLSLVSLSAQLRPLTDTYMEGQAITTTSANQGSPLPAKCIMTQLAQLISLSLNEVFVHQGVCNTFLAGQAITTTSTNQGSPLPVKYIMTQLAQLIVVVE